MFLKKTLWHGLTYVFALLLVLSVLASSILEANKNEVDKALGTTSTIIENVDGEGLYTTFTPNERYIKTGANGKTVLNTKAFLEDEIQMGRRTGYEGAVLLKNTNNALPLTKASGTLNVTLLGKRSQKTLLGSSQGVDAVGPIITLARALSGTATNFAEDKVSGNYSTMDNFQFSELNLEGRTDGAGAGFNLNQAMIERYTTLTASGTYASGYNDHPNNYNNASNAVSKEVPVSAISDVSIEGYKDAAIVVLGRPSSESGDYNRPAEGARSLLALNDEELGLIEYATTNFPKTIVLINTNSMMEIQELKDNPKVDAILWIGHPGNFGCLGIADILCGRVSPSGGLADIYATKTMSAPAMVNFGNYTFTNAPSTADGGRSNSNKYVVEAEGIYTGYRYYETRYYDAVYNRSNAKSSKGVYASTGGSWNYAQEVTYGFGYGLSYTDFTFEIVGSRREQKSHEKYTTIDVKVTNAGSVAGSTPVQIYAQAPYTVGGLEKSAVQLVEFGKTKVLAPGASETVTIEVDWQNLATYDMNYRNSDGSVGSYVLDAGDYYFAVGNGAHDALNNILAKQGKTTADGMDYNGKAALAIVESYNNGTDASTFGYAKNNQKVYNQIPYSDWNYYEPGRVTYLSRSDWSGTWPIEYTNMAIPASMLNDIKGLYYTTKTDEDTSDIKWGDETVELDFYDLALQDYDDPRWEQVLNKITLEDAITMAAYGGNTFADALSVGFVGGKYTENTGNGIQSYTPSTALINKDLCPWAVEEGDGNANMSMKVFGSAVLIASSFSHDLLYAMGEFMGQEAIIIGLPILWGPGGNTHRTAYNGRTGEYYSEDPVLTGVACMEFAVGARDNGLIASPKHYAFNDQEVNRNGIAPFLTEQRARETELRAFQIAFEATPYDRARGEDTGMLGMMTSFSKIGAIECTSSYGLINGIAVGEWGFHGYCVTDINDDGDLFDCIVIAGCTGYDNRMVSNPSWTVLAGNTGRMKITNYGTPVTLEHYEGDRTLQLALKESVHRTLYTFCQSVMMNSTNSSTRSTEVTTWWRATYTGLIIGTAVLTAACAAMFVISNFKSKEEN